MMNQTVKLAISRMEPTSMAAKLRQVMPGIEEKLAAGVQLGEIHKVLVNAGFELTFQTFKTYIYRYRKKERPTVQENSSYRQSVSGNYFSQRDICETSKLDSTDNFESHAPISMQSIDRLMKPSPSEQAEKLARYERLARKNRRGAM